MRQALKNIVVTSCFMLLTTGFMLATIIMPDALLSFSERRSLLLVPEYNTMSLVTGEYFAKLEAYFLDHFVLRDTFRGIKAYATYYMFRHKDNNNIYIVDNKIIKIEYPLREKAVLNAAHKLNEVYHKYLQGMNVHYAILPDKNYFAANRYNHLTMDYEKMLEIMQQNVLQMHYIDVFQTLTLEAYYNTDIHWKQEKLIGLANILLRAMGNSERVSENDYVKHELYPFYGSYYGQAARKVEPDTLNYLTNKIIENAVVFDHHSKTYSKVYMPTMFDGLDPYNVFLSGPQPLLTIINPANTSGKELLLFRDSFGSSIAPLFIVGYSKITLIDLRYIDTDLLAEYLDFSQEQDVLFLYNTIILNNSYMLK